jgi:hypothetical protein
MEDDQNINWSEALYIFAARSDILKHGSSQGILACRAGTRAPPAGTHETKKIK